VLRKWLLVLLEATVGLGIVGVIHLRGDLGLADGAGRHSQDLPD
jgi:hypothetical protein